MATIVNGRAIAQHIQESLRTQVAALDAVPVLSIIVAGENPVTRSFIRAKQRFAESIGVTFAEHIFPETVTTEELVAHIQSIAEHSDGIVVQLPLPKTVDTKAVLNSVAPEKDVDVLSEETFRQFETATTNFTPAVAGAVEEILNEHAITIQGKNVAVVGKGRLVGLPVKILFERLGALVSVVDSKTTAEDFRTILQRADIIVSGAGIPNLIQPQMLTSGVVLIDAGTSSAGRSVEGDIAEECAVVASVFSKTPGGVGPMTVAILFRNLIHSLKN